MTGRRLGLEVYPRVCGGTRGVEIAEGNREGLSPRVRGNQIVGIAARRALRSIPACAGEPSCALTRYHPPWVYPRVCGGTCGIAI